MNSNQNRVPAGVRTGGRFAATARAEASVSLSADSDMTAIGLHVASGVPDYSAHEMREAFRLGQEAARSERAQRTRSALLTAARREHSRRCGACHGADQSCIQIEEHFMPEVERIADGMSMAASA